ncbi:MAG: hypothetical protein KGD60_03415 [Candidatus Thorarchaeota archaeon]|nr:hypothetical protein [Candidatus Thorarchaeota archaeon]
MSDVIVQDSPKERDTSRLLAILIVVAIFLPHTLEFNWGNAIDNSYLRVALYAAFWMISLETGSTIAGPYSSTLFEVLTVRILVFCILFMPLYLIVIIAQSRFMKGVTSRKSLLRIVGSVLIVQMFILFAFFWWQLDGWAFAQAYPLPFLHILVFLSVGRLRSTKQNKS